MATGGKSRGSGIPFRNVYIYFALLIPLTLLAFAKSFFAGVTFSVKPLTVILNVHAALMVLWLLMLIAQASFIRTKRFQLHRWLGRSSYVIAPLIILAGLLTIHEGFNRYSEGLTSEVVRIETFGFGQILAFAVTWGLAILYRKRTLLHVRFMISTAFAVSTAIVLRIIFAWMFDRNIEALDTTAALNWALLTLLLLALIAMDWRRGMKRSPFWVVTILISVMHLGYWTFAKTDGWLTFCQWFADLF